MATIIFFIGLGYVLNIIWLSFGFSKMKDFSFPKTWPSTRFSIVVPFRNEAINLPLLLNSISLLNYPKDLFEVILVDDESDDEIQFANYDFPITVLRNSRKTLSPKKDAITTAIPHAKFDWIITTDADCVVSENWLNTFDAFVQHNHPEMIASGVYYQTDLSILDAFQQLDLLSLQGTTIGSFGNQQAFMCNGANFAYTKDFFYELNGFEGNETIASGDDVFLLQKGMKRNPSKVHFLKSHEALVKTQPEKSWYRLFHQRVRWASKTGNYSGIYSKQLGLSVFLMNLSLLFLIITANWKSLIVFFGIKFAVDLILLIQTSRFFQIKLTHLLASSLIYPLFSTLVAFYSFWGNYTWKGRRFKL